MARKLHYRIQCHTTFGEVVAIGKGQKVQRRRRREVEDERNPSSSLLNPYSVYVGACFNIEFFKSQLLKYCQTKRQIAVKFYAHLLQVAIHSSDREVGKYRDELEKEARPEWEQEVH
nr:hypothetical protein [Tanacetum cinerariifolium]